MNCRNCGRTFVATNDETDYCSDACNLAAPLEARRIEQRLGGLELDRLRRTIAVAGQRSELAALKREIRRDKRRLLELLAEPSR